MRLVFAIVSFALAAVLIGFGIAQRTVLAGDDHVTAAVTSASSAPVTIIDGKTLNTFDRSQTIEISGAESTFAAYGRASDIVAWVGDASYNKVGYDPETGDLTSELVVGTDTEVPDPAGSDLWLADFTEEGSLGFTVNVPDDISVVIIGDGIAPAPANVAVTWPLDNSTPFAVPLVISGSVLLLIGLVFLLLAINHIRKARGPRRKQLKLPRVPKPPAYKAIKSPRRPAAQPVPHGRRSARLLVVAPVVLVGAMSLGACASPMSTIANNDIVEASTKSAESTDTTAKDAEVQTPAVTEAQAKRIVARISATVEEADATGNAELIATRMAGPALELRLANYKIRAVDTSAPAQPAIPSGPVKIILPQQNDTWPRTVFVVIQDETNDKIAPMSLMLVQDDPRAQYKVHYAIALEPGAVIPKVAEAAVGTSRLDVDSKFLSVAPSELWSDYGDILNSDAESAFYDLFKVEGDTLRTEVGKAAKDVKKSKIPGTASLTFSNEIGTGQTIALATNDAGALVAVSLNEIETISPVESGAAVNAPSQVAALLGKALSTKGLRATYGDQLLFYVPGVDSGGKIVLLGYSQGLISAAEL
jgi:hypothetical protein